MKSSEKLSPAYLSCPVECPKENPGAEDNGFNPNRRKFCDGCDKAHIKNRFKEKTIEFWSKRLGRHASRFRFEQMESVLYDVIGCENLPKDRISVKTQSLLDVYLFEKNKARAIEDFAREKD